MKAPYPLRRLLPRKAVKLPDAALGLLLILGLVQIALCLGAATSLVPPANVSLDSAPQNSMYVTNSPVAGTAKPVPTEKS